MKTVLPIEILEYSIEKHRFDNFKKYHSIYWILLLMLFLIGLSLPLVEIDLFHNSRGLIKIANKRVVHQNLVNISADTAAYFMKPHKDFAERLLPYRDEALNPQTDLVVECYVSPSSRVFINKGDAVEFHFDAFPRHNWGKASGRVILTQDQLVDINGVQRQKVICSINERQLFLNNAIKVRLQHGLKLTAKFFIEKKSLLKLIFDTPTYNNNRT